MVLGKENKEREEAREKYQTALKYLENELKKRGTKFFAGNEAPGMLDYMVWPWLERKDCIRILHPELSEPLPRSDFPFLVNNISYKIRNLLSYRI